MRRDQSRLLSDLRKAQEKAKVELITANIHINGQVKAKEIYLGTEKLGTVVRIPSEWRVIWTDNGVKEDALGSPLATVAYSKDVRRAVKEAYGLDDARKTKVKKATNTKRRAGRARK